MFIGTDNALWKTLAEIAEDEGLCLYDVDLRSESSLVVYVTRKEQGSTYGESAQGGVTSDDCSTLCRRLMVFFQAEGSTFGLANEPVIEVSSPGINRTLRLMPHWQSAVGERVKVRMNSEREIESGKPAVRSFIAKLLAADGEQFSFETEGSNGEISLSLSEIEKARVEYQF